MKKLLLTLTALCAITFANAQEQGKIRVDFGLGYAIPKGGGGVLINLEPKYNIKDNMSVGLRFGAAVIAKNIEFTDAEENSEAEGEVSANGSYLGTFEYNFNNGDSSFAPFVGAGVGYYSVANVSFSADAESTNFGTDTEASANEIEADGKFGGMLRAGFDWGKFRLAAEYNIVPKSDLKDINGETFGTTKNGYFGVSLGFFLGGGKWGN